MSCDARPMGGTEELIALVEGVTDSEARALLVDVLRAWHPTATRRDFDLFADVAAPLMSALEKRKGVTNASRGARELFHASLHWPQLAPFLDALWWLVRAGMLIPLNSGQRNLPHYFFVTRAGGRFLSSTAGAHPLSPGFVSRIAARCTGLNPDAIELLEDARECFERGLLRPAIVLLGVACEVVIEDLAEQLAATGIITATVPSRAAARLRAVEAAIDSRFPETGTADQRNAAREARGAAREACAFAHDLRRRRNDGSHTTPRYPIDDPGEVEEFFASLARKLPNLWAMRP